MVLISSYRALVDRFLAETEICELDMTVGVQQDILRL